MPSAGLPPVATSLGALGVSNLDRFRTTNDLGLASYVQERHNDVTIDGRALVLAPLDNTGSGVDDGFALFDPNAPNNGAQLYNADGSYRKWLPTTQATPFAQWFATSVLSIVGFAFGATALGAGTSGAAGAASSTALDEAANVGAANSLSDASYAGADWGNVADFSAGGAAPLPAVADLAPAAAPSAGTAASSGLSMPTLQQVGQAVGIGSTVSGLLGGGSGGQTTAPRIVGYVPAGSGVYDNGTTVPGGATGPTYYAGGSPGTGAQFLQPDQAGGIAPSVLVLGAAAVVVLALALGHQ